MFETLPAIALLGAVIVLLLGTMQHKLSGKNFWIPILFALLFGGWSVFTLAREGPTAVWAEHIRNAWSNQIWFDLLLAFTMVWFLLLPRMRAVGMNIWLWLVLLLCTGSFGLLLAYARCLFLERDPQREIV